MLSRMGSKWRWYDWIFIGVIVIVVVGAITHIAPTSGLAESLHTGFHALALGVAWVGNGLLALASLLNQL
jgi:hypothetical protein